ncbi:XRE family transcriptional regulator [Rhodococcus sp. 06-621-2]|nr:XRE family transcriptional regulator [Rhodococcus sp. 06-621-2]OZD69115.1 XRE family transcriptional regulator [Rhodococcus sp. 06-1059B-a]
MARTGVRGFRADRLRELRIRAGLSIVDLALRLGVSRQAVSTWETGRSTPPANRLREIADELDVSISAFVPIPENRLHLADLRALASLSQVDAAKLLEISPTVLGDIERGTKKLGTHEERAEQMSRVYNVDLQVVRDAWARTERHRMRRARAI